MGSVSIVASLFSVLFTLHHTLRFVLIEMLSFCDLQYASDGCSPR